MPFRKKKDAVESINIQPEVENEEQDNNNEKEQVKPKSPAKKTPVKKAPLKNSPPKKQPLKSTKNTAPKKSTPVKVIPTPSASDVVDGEDEPLDLDAVIEELGGTGDVIKTERLTGDTNQLDLPNSINTDSTSDTDSGINSKPESDNSGKNSGKNSAVPPIDTKSLNQSDLGSESRLSGDLAPIKGGPLPHTQYNMAVQDTRQNIIQQMRESRTKRNLSDQLLTHRQQMILSTQSSPSPRRCISEPQNLLGRDNDGETNSLPSSWNRSNSQRAKLNSLLTRAVCETHEQDRRLLLGKLMKYVQAEPAYTPRKRPTQLPTIEHSPASPIPEGTKCDVRAQLKTLDTSVASYLDLIAANKHAIARCRSNDT